MIYADSSFFFSYYASDIHSARADAWRVAHPVSLLFSSLNRLELRNALELAVFQQRISAQESAAAWQTVEVDLRDGLLAPAPLPLADVLREAESLAAQHTAQVGSRSLDLLHIRRSTRGRYRTGHVRPTTDHAGESHPPAARSPLAGAKTEPAVREPAGHNNRTFGAARKSRVTSTPANVPPRPVRGQPCRRGSALSSRVSAGDRWL